MRYKTLAESNRAMMQPQYRPWSEISPSGIPRPAYRSRAEILDEIIEKFNRQPVKYRDVGDKTIASRSMSPIEMPREMAGARKLDYLFEKPLTFNWAIPRRQDALSTTRTLPQSDLARQMAYTSGITGGGQRISALQPASYWPETSFKLPERGIPGTKFRFPPFGGAVDFTKGKAMAEPVWGTHGGAFAPFPRGQKTVPSFGDIQWSSPRQRASARSDMLDRKWGRKEAEAGQKSAIAKGEIKPKKKSSYLNLFYKPWSGQGSRLRKIK